MKLHKALKLRKSLTGDIARIKAQIQSKNSYTEGSVNPEKYNVPALYTELQAKINELIGLKYAINEANREIQSTIYKISENKALIAFWNSVSVNEGKLVTGYSQSIVQEYKVQIDEETRNKMVAEFQKKVDVLQEEIDTYNYTTEIAWDDKSEDTRVSTVVIELPSK
jgi:uncharacterized small protein (DUF1192 family)